MLRIAEKQASKEHYFAAKKILEAMQKQILHLTGKRVPPRYRISQEDALRIRAILNVLIDDMHQKYLEQREEWKDKRKHWGKRGRKHF